MKLPPESTIICKVIFLVFFGIFWYIFIKISKRLNGFLHSWQRIFNLQWIFINSFRQCGTNDETFCDWWLYLSIDASCGEYVSQIQSVVSEYVYWSISKWIDVSTGAFWGEWMWPMVHFEESAINVDWRMGKHAQ